MLFLFAIPNCDTVKKARKFLEHNNLAYEFIDFKKKPPTLALIKNWSTFFGELPVNKKGLTYRKYKNQYEMLNLQEQLAFIIAHVSIIKRPILMQNDKTIAIGFNEAVYDALSPK